MRHAILATAAVLLTAGAAHATTVTDPPHDFLPSFIGTQFSDLDITSFTVKFDQPNNAFDFSATFDGAFDPTHTGIYVIGVDTGTGVVRPFANINEGNVAFNQAIVVRSSGVASLGANSLTSNLNLSGDTFTLTVDAGLLPSTGFATRDYLFNLWARNALVANSDNADFAPDNAIISAVPEPATWALMILGFGLTGAAVRGRRTASA
jgi:hypothetical protein